MLTFCDELMLEVKQPICYYSFTMRTTLTLDESVADGLKKLQRKNPDKPFKEIVNDLIRQGLQLSGINTANNEKFVIEPSKSAVHRPEFDFDNIGKLLEAVDGDFHK
jgi:hypothetical protein